MIDPNHFKVAQEYPKKKHDTKEKKDYFVSKRRYTAFNTYIEFEDYLNTLPEYERTFSEVKENNKPQKLFADIDIKPAIDDGFLETIVHIFIDTIILSFPEFTIIRSWLQRIHSTFFQKSIPTLWIHLKGIENTC